MSKRTMCLILMACVPTLLLYGSGSVSYSANVSGVGVDDGAVSVYLSQFNPTALASQYGGDASDYTLTKVVLTIDGSMSGEVTYENGTTINRSPTTSLTVSSTLNYTPASYTSANETYALSTAFSDVAQNERVVNPINNSGSGSVSSGDITTALASFIGSSTIQTSVSFVAGTSWNWIGAGTGSTKIESVYGSADVSVTYYYDVVPEPTSLALLGLGCVAILARRRFRKTTEI